MRRVTLASSWTALATVATVAAAVVACGGDDEADEVSAEFTGEACEYAGPTEFTVGDELEITVMDVTEERVDVGYAVTKVQDGTSVADISEVGVETVTEDDEAGDFLWSAVTEEGTERTLSTTLDVGGTWSVHCFVMGASSGGDGIFPATTFEVLDE